MNGERKISAPGKTSAARRLSPETLIPALVLTLGIFLAAVPASAQYVTNGTGGGAWTSPGTWSGNQVPSSTGNVTIAAGDSVWTNFSNVTNCGSLDIQSGATLNVLGYGVQMTGAFSIEAGGTYINNSDSVKAWPAGATGYTIDPKSTFILGSAGSNTLGWNKSDSTFGNVIIQPNSSGGISCGANLTIQGDLSVNPGKGETFRGIGAGTATGPSGPSLVHHVMGNVTVLAGQFSAVDGDLGPGKPMSCVWNIDGNVTVGDPTVDNNARFGPFSSAITAGDVRYGVFNIKGNLSFINGARLEAGTSAGAASSSEVGIINIGGNLTLDNTALVTGNSMGVFAINFNGKKPQTVSLGKAIGYTPNSGNAYPTLTDTIAAGSNVTFATCRPWGGVTKTTTPPANGWGGWVVNGTLNLTGSDSLIGTQSFTLNKGAALGIGSPDGITAGTAAGDTVGNILVSGTRTFSAEANYSYIGTSSQVTGNGMPTTVNDLTIDNADTVTLSQSTTINGTLYLTAGVFDNTIPFTLGSNGNVSITGGKLLVPTAVVSNRPNIPTRISIGNYPNPFNPTTQIQFSVTKNAHVTLSIYNDLGQKVATLVDGNLTAGVYNRVFDGSRYASGTYFARLIEGSHIVIAKMLMLK